MNWQEAQIFIQDSLKYSHSEIGRNQISQWLLEDISDKSFTTIRHLCWEKELTNEEEKSLRQFTKQLENDVPYQQVVGYTEFYGLKINVNEHVLTPRPETEELVQWVYEDWKNRSEKLNLVDIGTGSGCIALALKKLLPSFNINGVDISENALKIARKNAIENNLEVDFSIKDVLKEDLQDVKMIVSNPPYIPQKEAEEMEQNVLQYDPHEALFVPNDSPLLFYKRLAEIALSQKETVFLYCEIHHEFGQETIDLFNKMSAKTVELKHDLQHKPRMVKAVFN